MSNPHGNSHNTWPYFVPLPNQFFSSMPNQFFSPMPSQFVGSMPNQFVGSIPSQFVSQGPSYTFPSLAWPSPSAVLANASSPITSTVNTPPPSHSSNNGRNVLPRATDSPIVTSSPPFPPNWNERYQHTVTSLQNYQLFPIDPNTFEYSAIASLLDPALISTVEQIVNPTLWSRFVNTRKEMLKSKCNDLELLSKLELNETDLMASYQHSLNFETNPKVQAVPYNDNMALLFHCTRDSQNIENILRQGLDGLLGKGIYFTDNPEKSMNYDGCGGIIFIFAVLLGDCLSLDGPMYHFVREPEKWPEQKRNFTDLFFDSIVGQPGTGLDNEYVIYNRYQCCPLYMVKYSPGCYTARANPDSGVYVTLRKYLPPVGWMSSKNYNVTPARVQKTWPFFAAKIFAKMGALVETCDKSDEVKQDKKTKGKIAKKPSGLSVKLQFLNELGFHDRDKNIDVLRKHKFNLDESVSYLLDEKDGAI